MTPPKHSRKDIVRKQTLDLTVSKSTANSNLIKELSNCHTCFVKPVCPKYEQFDEAERAKGCQDVRNLYFQSFQQYTKPEIVLQRTLAELETHIKIKTILDGKEGDFMSNERLSLLRLKKDFLEMSFKYGKGTTTNHIVQFKEDDRDMIDMTEISEADYE